MNAMPGRPRPEEPTLVTLEFVSPTAAEIARPPRRLARSIVLILAALFACIMAVLILLPMDRVVVAQGRVVSTVPNVLIQPLEPAIVRSFHVRVNQVVRRGELIAHLDPTFAGADVAALSAQELSLAAEVERLEAEAAEQPFAPGPGQAMALQAAIFGQRRAEREFRVESLRQRMNVLQEGMARSRAELAQLAQRAQIAGQIETMRRDLERVQVGSRLNSLIATDSRLEIQRTIAALEGQLRGSARELASVAADLDAFLGNWRAQVSQDLAARRRDLSDVREGLAKARLRHTLIEMRAPVDAVVQELGKNSPGSVLAAGELLAALVPLEARLEVEAEIQPRDLAHVGMDDRVALKFETFPFIRHGMGWGRVLNLSQDTTRAQQVANAPAFYRARVSVDEMNLVNIPPEFRLMPGMPVQADIMVGTRTPLRYLLERALPNLVEAMREP
ncbi:HlyD family type I secretion periplasmic adaptor subunit [Roseococcus sp. DSY-14]|uniref:HlyD family type I secretion periplasmic adaptor subunit n=1 Tax=Roseococcus sp. DSY-14 TaxID=3369650 RepID=UPI00387AD6E2